MLDHPNNNEYEISLFGPGFGEGILVHLGSRKWMVIDSCVDAISGKSIPLTYLNDLNVNVADDVEMVVATHWHNDHIAGIFDLFSVCNKARFVMPRVLMQKEFFQLIFQNASSDPSVLGKATTEMAGILRLLKDRDRVPVFAGPDTLLLGSVTAKGAEVFSLSPHDRFFDAFLKQIGSLLGRKGETQRRLPSIEPNRISVAMLIKALGSNILLGADLEESKIGGWTDIIKDSQSLKKPIHIIKIPHHGSQNGHCPDIWANYLIDNPIAILTPFNKGRKKLPALDDIERLTSLTTRAYTTASPDATSSIKRSQTVDQQLGQLNIKIRLTNPKQGHVRLRCNHNDQNWSVRTFGTAKELRHLKSWARSA